MIANKLDTTACVKLMNELVNHVLFEKIRLVRPRSKKLDGAQVMSAIHLALHSDVLQHYCDVTEYDYGRVSRVIYERYAKELRARRVELPELKKVKCKLCKQLIIKNVW